MVEVGISADDFQRVLPGESGDPKVYLWNWPPAQFEAMTNRGIHVGGFSIGRQNDGLRFQAFEAQF